MIDVDVAVWSAELIRLHTRIAGRFKRSEPRRRAGQYLFGLAGRLDRKNGWTLAEQAGDLSPDGMQRLLRWADWDVDGVRDDVRDYVAENLGEPQGVLSIDEAFFLKKGVKSAGVARQCSRVTGRVENCQVGVFMTYGSSGGQALVDRRLYLPPAWTDDRARCREAGIPEQVGFATKAELAREMLARAFTAGIPARWVTMDNTFGQWTSLRIWLEEQDHAYVAATGCDDDTVTAVLGFARAGELIASLPPWAWSKIPCDVATHGPLDSCWARLPVRILLRPGRGRWLLARRDLTTGELAYYVCYGPRQTQLTELVRVADSSLAAGECLRQAKLETGLDEYQVRGWRPWYAHITLSMAAYAGLAVARRRCAKE